MIELQPTISVLIADDQPEIREGLTMLLDAEPDLRVVGAASNGREAIELAGSTCPDVVIMDIRMPELDGVEATRLITAAHGCCRGLTKVLVLTTFDHDDTVYSALRAGASGYMLKEAAPAELARAVRLINEGGSWLDPSVQRSVIDTLRATTPVDEAGRPDLSMLSPREREVLTLMGDAPTNTQLAETLFVSEATVKTHISRLLMKTGSHDRAQLVALAYKSGLVRP